MQKFYLLSGRPFADFRHIKKIRDSLPYGHFQFPRLLSNPYVVDVDFSLLLSCYLGTNYELLLRKPALLRHAIVLDNPSLPLFRNKLFRVHADDLAFLVLPMRYNIYYRLKYESAFSYLSQFYSSLGFTPNRSNSLALVFTKSMPYSSIIDHHHSDASHVFDKFIAETVSSGSMNITYSSKQPHISSVDKFGLPIIRYSDPPSPEDNANPPSHVFAFQSTAVLKYLFDDSVQCFLSRFHPYYIGSDHGQLLKPTLIKELSHRFASINYFSEEFLPFLNAH